MSAHQTPQLPGRNSGPLFFKDTNMTTFTTHNHDANIRNEANGTSLQGYIKAGYAELTSLFGNPIQSSGKVRAEWNIKFPDGTFATIYDWKSDAPLAEYTDWHVGGMTKQSVDQVQIAIDLHREVAEAEKEKPVNEVHKAFIEANETRSSILDSLAAHKGEAYKNAVLSAVCAIKLSEINSVMLGILSDHGMPSTLRKAMKEAHGTCVAQMLAAAARAAGVSGDDTKLVDEMMEWADKINKVEQGAAKKIVSFAKKGGE